MMNNEVCSFCHQGRVDRHFVCVDCGGTGLARVQRTLLDKPHTKVAVRALHGSLLISGILFEAAHNEISFVFDIGTAGRFRVHTFMGTMEVFDLNGLMFGLESPQGNMILPDTSGHPHSWTFMLEHGKGYKIVVDFLEHLRQKVA